MLDCERWALVLDGQPMTRGEGATKYVGYFGLNEFDVEVRSSAQVLDKIFQFRTYAYLTPQDLSDLLAAIDDVLNPQGSLCSFGTDKRIREPGEFLRARIQASERRAA